MLAAVRFVNTAEAVTKRRPGFLWKDAVASPTRYLVPRRGYSRL